MSSNGSTSMATICGGSLALMDAGVPISNPCAGISYSKKMQMVPLQTAVLTDILGAEDHFGDMDFKIAGTKDGITGFQLDLKILGLPFDITLEAIKQNAEARSRILGNMESTSQPRDELREHAPRIHSMQIDPDKIGALIGPGGKIFVELLKSQGLKLISMKIMWKGTSFASSKESMDRAIQEIDMCTAEIEIGKTYRGIVRGIKEFGAFVECLPGKEGLVHISELADFRVNKTEDICKLGDEMIVKCIGLDKGKVKLSRKAALEQSSEAESESIAEESQSIQN